MLGHCTVSESRYIALRNQLDELGYHYILGVESVHLVEQILSDFVHTTNNLYHYKQLSQRCIEEQRNFDLGVAPYKEDNARLVRECNALHLKLMHIQEDVLKSHKGLKRQLHKLEMENRDLRFINSQQLSRINELELECVDSSKKLMEQQCIEYTRAGINTGPASKKKPIPQSSSVSRGRLRKIVSEPLRVISPSQKDSCDMAGGQENQVPHLDTLRSEQSLLQEKCSKQAASLVLLNEMVRARDCEIARLSSLLEGGRPHKAVCEDFKCNNKFDELQEEVNRLGKTNKQLEDHLADAVMKQHEAMTRAIKLADQLETVKRDTRYAERDGDEEHCKDSSKFTQLQERLDQVERELQYNKSLHARLETAQHDKRLEEAQGSSADDRRKMTDRINQFTLIEQDLMEEIQHLKESSSLQKRRISELEEQVRGKKSSRRGSSTDVSPHRFKVAENNGSIVEKLESERDQYCIRLKQQGEKLQGLQANLEEAQLILKDKDQQLTTLHQQLLELQGANRQLIQEKFDSQTQADILFGEKEALETQLKSLQSNRDTHRGEKNSSDKPHEEQLVSCQAELCQQRALYNQIKILQEQTEHALTDAQSQLSAVQSELTTLQDRVEDLERERTLLEREVTGLKAERNTQRSTLAQVDQERDTLLLAVDNKTEQLAALEQDLKAKDTHLTRIKEVVADLQKKLVVLTDESVSKEQTCRSVERSVECLRQELEAAQRSRDSALRENRRLQDDLAAAIQDCRVANHSLEESRQEVENLKRQLQDYVDEVRRVEEILTLKEGERSEMLEHFRSLSVEATVLESNNHSLESEAEETRTALRVAQEHVADLEQQVYSKDALVRSYENQISELTVHVASLETQLRQQMELRQQTEADLTAVRELCVNIDDQKEVLSKQNSDNDIVKIHLESELSRLREELEIMQQHVTKDRAAVSSLEDMLANSRHEAVEQRAANQSLQAQVAQLQTNITDLQEKLALETAEVRRYASQAAALNQQVTELQREVINVRFNHARATEGQSYSTTL